MIHLPRFYADRSYDLSFPCLLLVKLKTLSAFKTFALYNTDSLVMCFGILTIGIFFSSVSYLCIDGKT